MVEFNLKYPEITKEWHDSSNYIVILESNDLTKIIGKFNGRMAKFEEPDMENMITAIVLEPEEESRRICRGLKLAMS